MTEQDVTDGLTKIFREAFDDEALTLRPEMTAADVSGWDSMKMITIVVAAEDRFGVSFTTREVDGLDSVGDLLKLIREKLSANGG